MTRPAVHQPTPLPAGRARRRPSLPRATLLASALAAGMAAWWLGPTPAVAQQKGGPPPQVIAAHPLARQEAQRLGFLGQFAAVDAVEIRAQVGGILTAVHFRDGDIVHKGDLLFSIDPVPYEIRLAQARAQLESAQARSTLAARELTRAQTLQRGDAGSIENVDQRSSERRDAQAAIDAAQAQIRDAQFDLDHCRIAAPITGRIGTHLVSVGNLIAGSRTASSPTTLLTTIVSLDPIWLDFDMSESDYDSFARARGAATGPLAETVEIAPNGTAAYDRRGTLDFVDNAIDRSSGVIHARATVPNPNLDLTPGAFARLRLLVGAPRQVLLVPDASILPDQSHHIVLTVGAGDKVTPKLVEPGELRGSLRIILSGLDAGDRVITDGLVYAAPGAKVAVREGAIEDMAGDKDTDMGTGN